MASGTFQPTSQQQCLFSTSITELLNLNDSSLCCVGVNAEGERCGTAITQHRFETAMDVIQKLELHKLDKLHGYFSILYLANSTLCPDHHRNQAEFLTMRWFHEVNWGFTPDQGGTGNDDNIHSRQETEAERTAEIQNVAAEARHEEALRQAQLEEDERALRADLQRRQLEEEASRRAEEEAERERLHQERLEKFEKARLRREQEIEDRLKREHEARQRRQQEFEVETLAWERAWERYEESYSNLIKPSSQPSNREINDLYFWPTRTGQYSSCNEAAVKEFFAHRPPTWDRKALRKQALRWHPDRTMTLFGLAQDQEAVQKMATMITQVITGIMRSYTG